MNGESEMRKPFKIVDPFGELMEKTRQLRDEMGIDGGTLIIALEPIQLDILADKIAERLAKPD